MSEGICCADLEVAFRSHDYPTLFNAVYGECPWCGHVIPESERNRLLIQPTVDDLNDLVERLKGASTFDEIVRRLGHPDHTGTGCGPLKKPWLRWAQFSRLWSSLVYLVGEDPEGRVTRVMQPQIRSPYRGETHAK